LGSKMVFIKVENVSKTYNNQKVLDNVSFTINDKSITCILGPANAGKTTLLRIIAGLESPDNGCIKFDGKDVTHLKPIERKVAMVFQSFALYPHMTVFDNIASPLKIAKLPYNEVKKRVNEIAELLKIANLLNRKPIELSGGERQRVAIARALVRDDTEVYLLDEPLTNLDYKIREEMRAELRRILQERGKTIVIASPDPFDAFAISQYVVILYMGKVLQEGEVQKVYENPRNTLVGKILARPAMNFIEACVKRDKQSDRVFLSIEDEVLIDVTKYRELLVEDEYLLGIRPERITLSGGRMLKDYIELTVNVILTEIEGSESIVHLEWKNKRLVMFNPYIRRFNPGEKIKIGIHLEDIYIFRKGDGQLVVKYGR